MNYHEHCSQKSELEITEQEISFEESEQRKYDLPVEVVKEINES
jgi:hypothetical protein